MHVVAERERERGAQVHGAKLDVLGPLYEKENTQGDHINMRTFHVSPLQKAEASSRQADPNPQGTRLVMVNTWVAELGEEH